MVSHNVDPLPPMDVREYMAAYGEANEAFIKAAEQVAGTFSSDELGSRAWFDASLKRMQQMKEAIKPFRQLSPPEEFQEAHELIQTSMNSYEQAFDIAIQSLEKKNTDFQGYNEHYTQAVLSFNEGNELLAELYNAYIKEWDEDLQLLDLADGIDRNSVIEHLSEDGQELYGVWGDWFNEDGTFNVGLIIHEGGTFVGYGRGDYTRDEPGVEGTWEYVHPGTLIFINERWDGVDITEAEGMRVEQYWEILKFDGDTLVMRDIDTWNRFDYVRGSLDDS